MHTHTLCNGCKINLYLKVGGRRPDGYHELESIFLPLHGPSDTLEITVLPPYTSPEGLHVSCDTPGIDPDNNTLTKTYAAHAAATGFRPPLRVFLHKGVPHGAGLGGGSANSAVLLQFLQRLACEEGISPLAPSALNRLAANIGADVPFFLLNRPAYVSGIGEKLQEMENPCQGLHLVLVCPDVRISTAWAFNQLDILKKETREGQKHSTVAVPDKKNQKSAADGLTAAHLKDTTPISHGLYLENDFEEVVFSAFPPLFQIWETLQEAGALSARLSGTGSSLFGLFQSGTSATQTAERLRNESFQVYTHVL